MPDLAVTFVALWANVLPVRCSYCERILFRTDIASVLFGGHGEMMDLCTLPDQNASAVAGGSQEMQGEVPTDQTTTAVGNVNQELQDESPAEESHG